MAARKPANHAHDIADTLGRQRATAAQTSAASMQHAWQQHQQQTLQKVLSRLHKRTSNNGVSTSTGAQLAARDAAQHEIAAALESLHTRVKVLEQQNDIMHQTVRDVEAKAAATELKLLTLRGKAPLPLPDEPMAKAPTVTQPPVKQLAVPNHRVHHLPKQPPMSRLRNSVPESMRPHAKVPLRKRRQSPPPPPPPPPPTFHKPVAHPVKSMSAAAWAAAGSHMGGHKAGPNAPEASRYEPEAALPPRGCVQAHGDDVAGTDVCVGGGSASIDSLVHCVRCVTYRRRRAPARSALTTGLAIAQQMELDRRGRGLEPQLWLEFGAWSGRSGRQIRDASFAMNRTEGVYSFDSFEGLPEDWRADPLQRPSVTQKFLSRGSFSRQGQPPYNEAGVHWEIGWFNVTLPPFLARHPQREVGFLHIDCDLYSSTDIAFRALERRLAPGAVVVFDELVNYPEYEQHEAKAFLELLARTGRGYRVLGAGPRLIVRGTGALRKMLATPRPCARCTPLFGGTSNEDVAVRLLPSGSR